MEKPTIWLVFSSGIDPVAIRLQSDFGQIAASRRETKTQRQLIGFSPAIAQMKLLLNASEISTVGSRHPRKNPLRRPVGDCRRKLGYAAAVGRHLV